MFNALTTCYLFLGGSGAGACVILSVLELVAGRSAHGHRCRHIERHREPGDRMPLLIPREFTARAWPLSLGILAIGILCLVVDVGHPERLLAFFVNPTFSPLSVGAWTLALVLLVAIAFTVLSLFDSLNVPHVAVIVLSVLGIIFGLLACVYTGILLETLVSVVAYQVVLLPLLFLVSSLSCGMALMFVAFAFIETRFPYTDILDILARIDGVLIVLEAVVIVAYGLWMAFTPQATLALEALTTGELSPVFWGGLVVVGLIIPWIMERYLTHSNASTQLLWVALCVLVGGLCVRLCVVGMAAYDVSQMPGVLYGML